MSSGWRWPLLNLIGFLATVTVNGLANALPLNGRQTGDVINRDPTLFLPANWTFSIWGLIYLGLAVFVIYGLLPAGRANARLQRISPFFALTCVANCVWLFLWHWEQLPLSMAAMGVLLLGLIGIYAALRRGSPAPSRGERICLWWPFSVYLGWVSVATIANATVVLARAGWDGWGIDPAFWAAFMIAVGGALAVAIGLGRTDPLYAAVFVWAFVGIAVRQRDTTLVAATAGVIALAVAVVALIALFRALFRANTLTRRADRFGATG